MKKLLSSYANLREQRHKLCSWACLIGIVATTLSLIGQDGSRLASNFFQALIVAPTFILAIDAFPKIWKSSWTFKLALLVLIINFISLFYGEELASSKIISKFFRRIIYTTGFIGGISVAMPLLQKYQKYIFYTLLACSLGAAAALWIFYSSPTLARLPYHFQDLHTNKAGWIYGLISTGILTLIPHNQSRISRILVFVALSALFSAVMLTSSRSSIPGVSSAILLFIGLIRNRCILIPVCAAIVAVIIYTATGSALNGSPKGRLISTGKLVNRKDSGRIEFWQELIGSMKPKEYIIGKGFLADHSSKKLDPEVWCIPHSLYVSSFFHGGILALLSHLALSGAVIGVGFYSAKRGSISILLLAGFAAIPSLVDGKSIIDISQKFPPEVLLFWIPVAIAVANKYTPFNPLHPQGYHE
jgi:hypothetical protein